MRDAISCVSLFSLMLDRCQGRADLSAWAAAARPGSAHGTVQAASLTHGLTPPPGQAEVRGRGIGSGGRAARPYLILQSRLRMARLASSRISSGVAAVAHKDGPQPFSSQRALAAAAAEDWEENDLIVTINSSSVSLPPSQQSKHFSMTHFAPGRSPAQAARTASGERGSPKLEPPLLAANKSVAAGIAVEWPDFDRTRMAGRPLHSGLPDRTGVSLYMGDSGSGLFRETGQVA